MADHLVKPTVEHLKEIKLFQCFSEGELTEILKLGENKAFEGYANIVIEGEMTGGLYLILEGVVGISKTNPLGGNDYDLGQLKSGSAFGEMSLIDDNPRAASVRALEETVLFHIPKDGFFSFLDANKDRKMRFFESCIRVLIRTLRETNDNYVTSQYQLWKTAMSKGKEAA